LITIMPVALVGIFIPELFFAKFGNFLAFIGVAFAPLCGIQIIDYFVLRRRRIDIRAIYEVQAGRPYYFWCGINPAAMLALGAGCCTYVSLLNPLTFQSRGPYAFVSASLPAAGVAAMVYYMASLWVIRAGRGGYNQG
jgi:NCS1 family nucleobase:cation symporter-1